MDCAKLKARVDELEGQLELARKQERVLREINDQFQREHLVLIEKYPPGEARIVLENADAAARLPALENELHKLNFELSMLLPKALALDSEVTALRDENDLLKTRLDGLHRLLTKSIDLCFTPAKRPEV